jgi:micrococcal nuclease
MTRHLAAALLCWTVTATPIRAIDGDTIVVSAEIWPKVYVQETVRLARINAPELSSSEGKVARDFASRGLMQGRVSITACRREKYGRLLGEVYRGTENLSDVLAEGGMAVKQP